MLNASPEVFMKARGSQTKMWHQFMKSLTVGLNHFGKPNLLGWSPRDHCDQYLETK